MCVGWVGVLLERVHSPATYRREDPGPEVSGGVDGIAAVEAKGHPYGNHDETNAYGGHALTGLGVPRVCDRQNTQQ